MRITTKAGPLKRLDTRTDGVLHLCERAAERMTDSAMRRNGYTKACEYWAVRNEHGHAIIIKHQLDRRV